MKVFHIFTVLLILFSCNNKTTKQGETSIKKFTEFPSTENKSVETKVIPKHKISNLLFADDVLVIEQYAEEKDYFVKFYNSKTFDFLGQAAKHGKGPGEIIYSGLTTFDRNNRTIYIVDRGRNNIVYKIDIDNAIENVDYIPQKLFKIATETESLLNFNYIGNEGFVFDYIAENKDSTDHVYTFCDNTGKITGSYLETGIDKDIHKKARATVSRKRTICKNGRLFSAYRFYDRLISFDVETKQLIFEQTGPLEFTPKLEINSQGFWMPKEHDRLTAYTAIAASDDHIYCLWSGTLYNLSVKKVPEYACSTIFVFDYQGNPVKEIELDKAIRPDVLSYRAETNELYGIYDKNDSQQKLAIIKL